MKTLTERDKQVDELAKEIVQLARNIILMNMRYMARAIGNIKMVSDMSYGFASNASYIVYSPYSILIAYREDENLITRNLMHAYLHELFRHSFVSDNIHQALWNLASDIAVENVINSLNKDVLHAERERKQKDILERLSSVLPSLSAERIYSYLVEGNIPAYEYDAWHEVFKGDDHELWYDTKNADYRVSTDIDLERLWQDISKKMLNELETVGGKKTALVQSMREINRTRYNYTEFLKRFGVHNETMRISEEEFDTSYYTYGLELLGNIPLIEPLEYSDYQKIRDFVIAIDTSGSVQGEIVQKFIQHTHDVLASQNRFDQDMNLYILQCDDEIRDIAVINTKEEFEHYFKEREIKGLGRTDFRPVFTYINQLMKERRIRDMRGLLYFTDGKGKFPEQAPSYDTAFIIHNDSMSEIYVPEWEMKIELMGEEIMNL